MIDQRSWVHRAQHHIQKLCLGNRGMSTASIAVEVKRVGASPSVLRRKPLLKMMHKKARKQFSEDKQNKDMDYWNHVPWWDQDKLIWFRWCQARVAETRWGVQRQVSLYLPTVKHGGECVMVWGCMSAADTGELQFIEGTMNTNMYCNILKLSMIPSLWRLGRRAVFQHDNNPKHTSKTTTALLKKLRVKVIFGTSSNGRWRSARSLTSTSSVMSSWRSGRGLQWQPLNLWTPCPRGLRQCWKIMVATQNIDTLGPI